MSQMGGIKCYVATWNITYKKTNGAFKAYFRILADELESEQGLWIIYKTNLKKNITILLLKFHYKISALNCKTNTKCV